MYTFWSRNELSTELRHLKRRGAFDFPTDHVVLFGCSGDQFMVRIIPRPEGFEQQTLRHAHVHLQESCIWPEAGTLSNYNRHPHYQALFWALPGEEKFVPVPLPLMVKDWTLSPAVEVAPEAFALSTDVVAFYRPMPVRSEIHIIARDAVGFMPISRVEVAGQALRALNPHTVVFAEQSTE